MTDDAVFLRAIEESPRQPTPRLVYADWLEERGDVLATVHRCEAALLRSPRVRNPWSSVRTDFDSPADAMADAYLASDERDRTRIRESVGPRLASRLVMHVRRFAVLFDGEDDIGCLRRGLVTAVIENARIDFRDSIISLVILRHAADVIGLETRPCFDEALEVADEALTGVLVNARDHSAKYVQYTLSSFVPIEVRRERGW